MSCRQASVDPSGGVGGGGGGEAGTSVSGWSACGQQSACGHLIAGHVVLFDICCCTA